MEAQNNFPRTLIISHNCLSTSGSNGRTLANFFEGWDKEAIAQFYISTEIPDSPVCDNYFRVSDMDALRALIKGEKVGSPITKISEKGKVKIASTNNKRTLDKLKSKNSFSYIGRNLIWDSGRWKGNEFKHWVDQFNPQLVLFQAGDFAFMYKIAMDIANTKNIPLLIYNSEDYYFKDKKSFSPLYHIYRHAFKRQFERTIEYATHSVYNSEILKETYDLSFSKPNSVLYTGTTIQPIRRESKDKKRELTVSYLGNLGVGRIYPLLEIGKAIKNIDPNINFNVYGKLSNDNNLNQLLSKENGINYKGIISYGEVISVMNSSDLLVHAEDFSEFSRWDLKHAFSTKIADSLACGSGLLIYGPPEVASVKYLKRYKAASIVTRKSDLEDKLKEMLFNEDIKNSYVENGLKLVKDNHSSKKNSEKFKEIIIECIKGEENHESPSN